MRKYDSNTVQEIEDLIRNTDSPETKGILLVLLRVAGVLEDAINSNHATQEKLANLDMSIGAKVKELTDDKTFSRGFIKGIATLWIVVQIVFGYVVATTYENHTSNVEAVHRLEEKVRSLEQKQTK